MKYLTGKVVTREEMKMKTNVKVVLAMLVALSFCAFGTGAQAATPVAHWELDEGSGLTAYDSAGSYDGLVNVPSWTMGKIGGGLSFDGSSNYIQLNSYVSTFDNYATGTFACWFKIASGTASNLMLMQIADKDTPDNYSKVWFGGTAGQYSLNFGHKMNGDLRISAHIDKGAGYFEDDTWHHLAVVVGSNFNKIYVDGNEESLIYTAGSGSTGSRFLNIQQADVFYIGARHYNGLSRDMFFDGDVDDVSIYAQPLSAQEVGQLYRAGSGGLIGRWSFDEGAGPVAYDSAGTNDGAIYGAQWADGQVGGALDFDGADDYVDLGNDPNLKPALPITLAAWIKFDTDVAIQRIICLDNWTSNRYGAWLALTSSGKLTVGYGDGGVGSTSRRTKNGATMLDTGVWYQVAGIIRGPQDMDLYVNGINDGGIYDGTGGNLAYSSGSGTVGSDAGVDAFFSGSIDEVMVYERALSAAEIWQLFGGEESTVVYHVDGSGGSDGNPGLSRATAFATIQKGIDSAEDGYTVLVWPGVYQEECDFNGKAITVKSAADAAVVRSLSGYAFRFHNAEGHDSRLENLVLAGGLYAIELNVACTPTIKNLTIADNDFGIACFENADPNISNCIFYNNLYGDMQDCTAEYSWVEDSTGISPVSYWKLDDASGALAMDSAGSNDGTVYGDMVWTAGQVDGALGFDGSADYVQVGDDADLDFGSGDNFAISLWFKVNSGPVQGGPVLVEKRESSSDNRGYTVYWEDSFLQPNYRKVNFALDLGGSAVEVGSTTNVDDGTWHHLLAMRFGTALKLYLDGSLEGNVSGTGYDGSIANSNSLKFGSNMSASGQWFSGRLDEVAIYDQSLADEEIERIYQAGLGGMEIVDANATSEVAPGFADADNGDYHLLSEDGRYVAAYGLWSFDDVTSVCVDGGNPLDNPMGERMPNGGRVNMGAYGGTAYGSMSQWPLMGDNNRDGKVDIADLAVQAAEWLMAMPWVN
ncbi:MAG: LamG domain-containing protein [Planctomycetes bacterium]|nr:LamG domain-containing protein [Planctomycetota bacterium]